jgi:hypothetical protein
VHILAWDQGAKIFLRKKIAQNSPKPFVVKIKKPLGM